MERMGLAEGSDVRVVMTKWADRPHWEYDARYLGADQHGTWLGCPVGTLYARPGMQFASDFAGVVLVPAGGAPHLTAFNDARATYAIYADITTPPVWDGPVLRAIDLDLDVVKRQDGRTYLDDEDEFAAHQVAYAYPPEVVAMAEQSAADVLEALRAGDPPYDGSAEEWLQRMRSGGFEARR